MLHHYLPRGAWRAVTALVCVGLIYFCIVEIPIIANSRTDKDPERKYLVVLGAAVHLSLIHISPEDMYKQILPILVSVLLFLFGGWWLRSLKRSAVMRTPVAVLALALMALNVLTSESVNGARNWLEVAGYSLQPSELVKVAYIYVGASTLDRLYRRRNLYSYIAFSAACVIALALIGDFGTALIFFARCV